MFASLEPPKRRSPGMLVGSIFLHVSGVVIAFVLPILSAAEAELPVHLQNPPLEPMVPYVEVSFGKPDAGGGGTPSPPKDEPTPAPKPPPAAEPVTAAPADEVLQPSEITDLSTEPIAAGDGVQLIAPDGALGPGNGVGTGPGIGYGTEPGIQGDPNADPSAPAIGLPGMVGLVMPVLVARVEPIYPEVCRRAGIQGQVILQAVIGLDGRVADVETLRSAHPALADAAEKAVKQWRYRAGELRGRPIAVRMTVVVTFQLSR